LSFEQWTSNRWNYAFSYFATPEELILDAYEGVVAVPGLRLRDTKDLSRRSDAGDYMELPSFLVSRDPLLLIYMDLMSAATGCLVLA